MVLLEAMAMNIPVVATDVGIVSDVVVNGESGVIVAPGDVTGIAEGVIHLLTLDERSRLSLIEAGYRRVKERFSLEIVAARQKDIYNGLYRK